MRKDKLRVIYWDASAILSALFKDSHSDDALKRANEDGVHLISSLAYAETCAVIARMQRERILADVLIETAHEVLAEGPWRRLNALPEWNVMFRFPRSGRCAEQISGIWPRQRALRSSFRNCFS